MKIDLGPWRLEFRRRDSLSAPLDALTTALLEHHRKPLGAHPAGSPGFFCRYCGRLAGDGHMTACPIVQLNHVRREVEGGES